MSTDDQRPMTSEEAAALFSEERRLHGPVSAMMEELKVDLETIVGMINMLGEKGMRRAKAREFAKAFQIPDELLPQVETLFYGELEPRVEAGRDLWKWANEFQRRGAVLAQGKEVPRG